MRVYLYIILSAFLGLPPFQPLEREFERRLTENPDGNEDAKVRMKGSRLAFLLFGICKYVRVEISGLKISNLRAEKFKLELSGVRFRPFSTFVLGKARVRGAQSIQWSISLSDEDLETFLRKRSPFLANIQTRIDEEGVSLHHPAGIASLFSIPEAFTIKGRLALSKKKDVMLDLDHFSAFGVNPGKPFWNAVTGVINPVIKISDINRLLMRNDIEALENVKPQTSFEEIILENGRAIVHGAMDLVRTSELESSRDDEPEENKKRILSGERAKKAVENRKKARLKRQEGSRRRPGASEPPV